MKEGSVCLIVGAIPEALERWTIESIPRAVVSGGAAIGNRMEVGRLMLNSRTTKETVSWVVGGK